MAERPADSAAMGIEDGSTRPELERAPVELVAVGGVDRRLSKAERVWGREAVRKFTVVLVLLAVWQAGAALYNRPLSMPTASATFESLWENIKPDVKERSLKGVWDALAEAPLIGATARSLKLLAYGYAIGVALACVLSICATFTRIGRDVLETLTAMFSPLPAIALVPLALIWFGLGNPWAMIFVLAHSVLWPVALNMHAGFRSSGQTLRMVGRNYGLGPLRFVLLILIPASLGAIITGLKIGWAFAWRTLIAAELVFGSNGDQGGLGWFVFVAKNNLQPEAVFAGLLMVVAIGLVVENLIFRTVEVRTIRRWGVSH
ncbi:MAG TPA: ABC transporter permease [Phycisphaerales bacterium]|nr:ABC transporter permease [Phycisphaerales bacterium]